MNVEIVANSLELRLAAQAGGADARALRKFLKASVVARAEGVAWILAFCDGGDLESTRKFSGEIFQRMYGEIDAPSGQSLFNLLREHALCAYLGEGDIGDFVTRGVYDFDLDLMSAGAQEGRDVVGLPEG